jgi:hypothetical protein
MAKAGLPWIPLKNRSAIQRSRRVLMNDGNVKDSQTDLLKTTGLRQKGNLSHSKRQLRREYLFELIISSDQSTIAAKK